MLFTLMKGVCLAVGVSESDAGQRGLLASAGFEIKT